MGSILKEDSMQDLIKTKKPTIIIQETKMSTRYEKHMEKAVEMKLR